jgi:hypothetical protein
LRTCRRCALTCSTSTPLARPCTLCFRSITNTLSPRSTIAACGQPSSSHFTNLGGRANITGVGFFDIPHGQTGVAPNAIELHPVLKFLASSCSH